MSEQLPRLVDTHCHLVLLEERGLLSQALEGALAAGVDEIVSVGLNLEDSDHNRRIAEEHDGVYFTCGWHPHEKAAPAAARSAHTSFPQWVEAFRKRASARGPGHRGGSHSQA